MNRYPVLITETAWAEIEEAYQWLSDQASSETAENWRAALMENAKRIALFQRSYPIAPEADLLGKDFRHAAHGKRYGVYRIVFEVMESKVIIQHVRHAMRQPPRPEA